MYHAIVRKRIIRLFASVNRGDAQPVIDGFARGGAHCFVGDSALSDLRTGREAMTQWYGRLYRLFPQIRFDLQRIDIAGPPWNTVASVEWTETNLGADGQQGGASGVHVARLKWGKMTRLLIVTDTARLEAALDRLAAAGVTEAHAAPITG